MYYIAIKSNKENKRLIFILCTGSRQNSIILAQASIRRRKRWRFRAARIQSLRRASRQASGFKQQANSHIVRKTHTFHYKYVSKL